MDLSSLFRSSLALIDSVAASVCRRAGLRGADAEDFAGEFKLALIADDYAVLRSYEGRAALGTFLTVVAHRLLINQQRAGGRWHPSTAALRMDDAGVLLERAVRRDGRSIDEVLPLLQSIDPLLTREAVVGMEAKLPHRSPRPQMVELEPLGDRIAGGDAADARAAERDAQRLSHRAGDVVRRVMNELDLESRSILRLRFGADMSVADVSRALRIPQRPLYRQLERLLQRIRRELEAAGLDASAAAELIGGTVELDFALRCENGNGRPTNEMSVPMTKTESATP